MFRRHNAGRPEQSGGGGSRGEISGIVSQFLRQATRMSFWAAGANAQRNYRDESLASFLPELHMEIMRNALYARDSNSGCHEGFPAESVLFGSQAGPGERLTHSAFEFRHRFGEKQ
jgi:hypothetical protein